MVVNCGWQCFWVMILDCVELFMCIAVCGFNLLVSQTRSFFSSFFFPWCFLTPSLCESSLYSGARLRPQGFTSHTPRWQFIVPHTDNDLHFLSCLTWWPCACECVTRSNGIFYKKVFTECTALGNTSPASPATVFLAPCVTRPDSIRSNRYCFISGCEWYIISPAGWCELVVSFVISIDESSLGESISRGVGSLVAQPPQLAVPNWRLGCLTLPAAP